MQHLLGVLSVIAMAMAKFLFSGAFAYGLGYSFWETLMYTAIGGCFGMILFYFTGSRALEWFRHRYIQRTRERSAKGLPPKPIFTRTNKTIVRIKHRYGMFGLAAFAPPTLSIPITAVLAAKYFRHDRRTLPTLLASVVAWSVVLSIAWSFIR